MKKTLEHMNKLQMPTWRWLHINEAADSWEDQTDRAYGHNPAVQIPDGVSISPVIAENTKHLPENIREAIQFAAEHKNNQLQIQIPEGCQLEEAIVIQYRMDADNCYLVNQLAVHAGKNSSGTIYVSYVNDEGVPAHQCGHTYIEAAEGAKIRLIQSQLTGASDHQVNATQGVVDDQASLEILLQEVGSRQTVSGCDITLAGRAARAEIDSLYIGKAAMQKDMNYRIAFVGANTEGTITVRGALAGAAEKKLKSTIDFHRGAAGAKGSETETVLVFSDAVKNISAPLLLCGEDHVEGEHATNIGRPDPDKLYYLMSRGFTHREAKKILVEAGFAPHLQKLAAEDLQAKIRERIGEVVHEDE